MNYEGMEKGKVTVKFDSNRANEANPTSTSKQSHNKKPAAAGFLFDYELIELPDIPHLIGDFFLATMPTRSQQMATLRCWQLRLGQKLKCSDSYFPPREMM